MRRESKMEGANAYGPTVVRDQPRNDKDDEEMNHPKVNTKTI
jgi:hypothetical protein